MTSTETLVQVTRSAKVLDHVETSNAEIRKVVQNIEDEMRSTQSEKISKGTLHIADLVLECTCVLTKLNEISSATNTGFTQPGSGNI